MPPPIFSCSFDCSNHPPRPQVKKVLIRDSDWLVRKRPSAMRLRRGFQPEWRKLSSASSSPIERSKFSFHVPGARGAVGVEVSERNDAKGLVLTLVSWVSSLLGGTAAEPLDPSGELIACLAAEGCWPRGLAGEGECVGHRGAAASAVWGGGHTHEHGSFVRGGLVRQSDAVGGCTQLVGWGAGGGEPEACGGSPGVMRSPIEVARWRAGRGWRCGRGG